MMRYFLLATVTRLWGPRSLSNNGYGGSYKGVKLTTHLPNTFSRRGA